MSLRFAWLRSSDEPALRLFLKSNSPLHGGLLALVEQGILRHRPMAMVGAWERKQLRAVMLLGASSLVSRCEDPEALTFFGRCLGTHPEPLVMLSGPATEVGRIRELFQALRRECLLPEYPQSGQVQSQMLMVCEAKTHLSRSSQLRPALAEDLETLVCADLAMVQDELGFNPFAFDLVAHRRGVARRIAERRTWMIGAVGGEVRFKADVTACSEEVAQLAGVYTAPAWRQQGLAREGLGELCALLLRDLTWVALQVSVTNAPAIGLYEQLGFRRWASTQTVWFAPDSFS